MKFKFYLLTAMLALVVIFMPDYANAKVVGNIYSTDILAYVNSKPINSYNIGGRTVIIAEELDGYGFNVEYDDSVRTLWVKSYFNNGYKDAPEIKRGKVGKITGNIYETDIKVYYNGILINGYNIGGRTAICLEDMGDLTDSPNGQYGYSLYLGKSIWDAENRTISYESYISNESEILGVSRVYHRFKDNVIYTFADDYYAISEFSGLEADGFTGTYTYSPGAGMSRYNLKPLYFDNKGELLEVGLCVVNPNSDGEALMWIKNPEYVKNIIKTFKTPQKSHDEALKYFSENTTVFKKLENDKYTVLGAKDTKGGIIFVYINKNGGFVVSDFYYSYGMNNNPDTKIDLWFDSGNENVVVHSVYPFGGPHGVTTATFKSNLNSFDFE